MNGLEPGISVFAIGLWVEWGALRGSGLGKKKKGHQSEAITVSRLVELRVKSRSQVSARACRLPLVCRFVAAALARARGKLTRDQDYSTA